MVAVLPETLPEIRLIVRSTFGEVGGVVISSIMSKSLPLMNTFWAKPAVYVVVLVLAPALVPGVRLIL